MYLPNGEANHLIGGEITYRCLGGNNFELSVHLYRDCGNPGQDFDPVIQIGIFDANNNVVDTLEVPFDNVTEQMLPVQFSCVGVPSDICIHRAVYTTTTNLPFSSGGYIISHQRCCRDPGVTNIVDASNTGFTFYTEIREPALLGCNNSAVFNSVPPYMLCVNQPMEFDHSATDEDNNFLVYVLSDPLAGGYPSLPTTVDAPPYDSINWAGPFYNINNMLGGANPLSINSDGILTATPQTQGKFAVGLSVYEFGGNGIISVVRREFHFVVRDCQKVPVAKFEVDNQTCDPILSVEFENKSEGNGWIPVKDFKWEFDDGTFLIENGSVDFDTTVNHTYPTPDDYNALLIAETENPFCRDSTYKTLTVTYDSLSADFDFTYDNCSSGFVSFQFENTSNDDYSNILGYEWLFNNDITSFLEEPFYNSTTGEMEVRLIAVNGQGCADTVVKNLDIPMITLNLDAPENICEGTNFVLNENGSTDFQYTWSPNDQFPNPNEVSPVILADSSQIFYVTILNELGDTCMLEQPVEIHVPPSVELMTVGDTSVCAHEVDVWATSPQAVNYEWANDMEFDDIFQFGSYTATVLVEGTQTVFVRAIDAYDCSATESFEITENVVNILTGDDDQLCRGDTTQVMLTNLDPDHQLSILWSSENGEILSDTTQSVITVAPFDPVVYHVRAANQYGCETEDSVFIDVSAIAPPLEINIQNDSIYPGDELQLLATYDPNYTYFWSEESTLFGNTIHNPTVAPLENTTYNLTVRDEYGCVNLGAVFIVVKDFSCGEPYLFVPDAFTPNGDGMNDVLYVRGNAVNEVQMMIYNKWGNKIFETNSLDEGWDGTFAGKPLPPDVYSYYLHIKCFNGEDYFKRGDITIIK